MVRDMVDGIGDMESIRICLAVSMDGSIDMVDTVGMAIIIAMGITIGIIIRIPIQGANIMALVDIMDLTNIRFVISDRQPLVRDRTQVSTTGVKCRHVILDHRPDRAWVNAREEIIHLACPVALA